jgi:hypothetical protein
MDKEKFKESFGNPKLPKLPKMTLEKFMKTERAIENFINKK